MKAIGPETVTFTAWEYDAKFHALIGKVRIVPEVCASGEVIYRLPKFTTLVEPPSGIPPGQKAVFLQSTQSWLLVSDHRGEWWLDELGRPKMIERLGNPAMWAMQPLHHERAMS